MEGSVTYNYESGDLYRGEMYKGYRHGKGTMYYNDVDERYEGEWDTDEK